MSRLTGAIAVALVLSACSAAPRLLARELDPSNPEAPMGPRAPAFDLAVAPATLPELGALYACPMHPEVRSGKPGRCSECGMGLKAPAPDAHASPAEEHHHHGGQP